MSKKPTPPKQADPTLPFTPITINGVTYKMCFDFGALANAEDRLIAAGHDVNLLRGMMRRTFSSSRELFAASLYAYHPEIPYQEALALVTADNIGEIVVATVEAWRKNHPEASKENPPRPEETSAS